MFFTAQVESNLGRENAVLFPPFQTTISFFTWMDEFLILTPVEDNSIISKHSPKDMAIR